MNVDIRKFNLTKKKILRQIFKGENCTRASLVEATGLSNLTITKLVAELIEDGIVIEDRSLASTGGRRPSVLKLNPEFGYMISVDIGAYSVKTGVVKFDGEILKMDQTVYYKEEVPVKTIRFAELQDAISALLDKYGKRKFLGISIGISGMVNYQNGAVVFCPNLDGYNNLKIREILQQKFGLPVFLDTSARCMALAEQSFGCGRNSENFMLVSIGYSITAGVIVNSHIYRGANGFSGEIGHIQVSDSKDLCSCGNYGCLELYATIPMIRDAIIRDLSAYPVYSPASQMVSDIHSITIEQIVRAYNMGDKTVENKLAEIAEMIGSVLAGCMNLLNTDQVILSGGLIRLFPPIVAEISRTVMKKSLITVRKGLTVQPSFLGIGSAVQGGAVQVLNDLFLDT